MQLIKFGSLLQKSTQPNNLIIPAGKVLEGSSITGKKDLWSAIYDT